MEGVILSADDLAQLQKEFEDHRKDQNTQMQCLMDLTEENTRAVKELTESTQGVVTLYNDLQGAARVGIALQHFVVYLGKLGVFGALLGGMVLALINHFSTK